MAVPLRPRLRPLEIIPIGPKEEFLLQLRDPQGLGEVVVLPYGAVVLALLMDGTRTLAEIQDAFQKRTGVQVALSSLEEIIRRLDDAYLLAGQRSEQYRRAEIERYLGNPIRPASHSGGAYAEEPEALREQLAICFHGHGGPGPIAAGAHAADRALCGIVSPHVDLHRGGATFAWAYQQVARQSDAELFVIFGTAHSPMQELFCVSRKDFDTPLGVVRTDNAFIDRLAAHLASSVAGRQVDLFADELVHRSEHSIEFQTVFLQFVLAGKREFRIVPVLVGSFHDYLAQGSSPEQSPEFQAFVAAMRAVAAEHAGKVCYVSGADLAHIGPRYGDQEPLDEKHLAEQAADDRMLLETVLRNDAAALFRHVAERQDRSRICGLSPMYTMLAVLGSARGELLKYDQAVEPDGTACVSFASVAFHKV